MGYPGSIIRMFVESARPYQDRTTKPAKGMGEDKKGEKMVGVKRRSPLSLQTSLW